MGIVLDKSGFYPSTLPGAVIFECKWDCDGESYYTQALVEPGALVNINVWNDMVSQVAAWAKARKRKSGEIMRLRNLPC